MGVFVFQQAEAADSDSDHFSVEFEVESIASDDYDEDDASLSADDQVASAAPHRTNEEETQKPCRVINVCVRAGVRGHHHRGRGR